MIFIKKNMYFIYILIFIFNCSSQKKATVLNINNSISLNNIWEEAKSCKDKLPFCSKKFTFKSILDQNIYESLKLQKTENIQGQFYVFRLFFNPDDKIGFMPPLPSKIDNTSLSLWFEKNILSVINKNNSILKKYKPEKDKDFWLYKDVSIIATKCDIVIYPIGDEYNPMFFVYLWQYKKDNENNNKREITQKIENWTNKQIETSISIKEDSNGIGKSL